MTTDIYVTADIYLHFPTQQQADTAPEALRGKGYRAEARLGDNQNWLVLATREPPDGEHGSRTRGHTRR